MKKLNLTLVISGIGMLISAGAHANGALLSVMSLGVFGPNGEVISYEKQADGVHIRVCEKNTLKKEVEAGCKLAVGTAEVILSETDFREYVKTGLAQVDRSQLSPEQKALLEKSLTDLPDLDAKQKELQELKAKLKKLEDFKAENPNDYDQAQEKNLKTQTKCIEDSISGYGDIIAAKNQVAEIIDSLIADMDGKALKRVLRHSADKTGIAYNLLRGLAATPSCDPAKIEKAAAGYVCRSSTGALWKIETDTFEGKRVYSDLRTGFKVTEPLTNKINQYDSEKRCNKDGYRLPSGYPDYRKGKDGFPNQDSDFVALEKSGIRSVVPGMSDRWFWSSSVHPTSSNGAYQLNGNYGDIDGDYRSSGNNYDAILCVRSR